MHRTCSFIFSEWFEKRPLIGWVLCLINKANERRCKYCWSIKFGSFVHKLSSLAAFSRHIWPQQASGVIHICLRRLDLQIPSKFALAGNPTNGRNIKTWFVSRATACFPTTLVKTMMINRFAWAVFLWPVVSNSQLLVNCKFAQRSRYKDPAFNSYASSQSLFCGLDCGLSQIKKKKYERKR